MTKPTNTTSRQTPPIFEQRIKKLREIYADASEILEDRAGKRDPLRAVR